MYTVRELAPFVKARPPVPEIAPVPPMTAEFRIVIVAFSSLSVPPMSLVF